MGIFSLLFGIVFRFVNQIFMIGTIIVYLYSYYLLAIMSIGLYHSTFTYKTIMIEVILIYLVHLILMFLLQKFYLEKSIIKSIIWASIINSAVIIFLGLLSYQIYKSSYYLIDFGIEKIYPNLNYNYRFEELNIERVLTSEKINETKKIFHIYLYSLTILLISNIVIAFLLIKKKFNN